MAYIKVQYLIEGVWVLWVMPKRSCLGSTIQAPPGGPNLSYFPPVMQHVCVCVFDGGRASMYMTRRSSLFCCRCCSSSSQYFCYHCYYCYDYDDDRDCSYYCYCYYDDYYDDHSACDCDYNNDDD